MRIGFDIDGVLANFSKSYIPVIVGTSGRDLFQPGDDLDPPVWDWDVLRGYTKEEIADAWKHIRNDDTFWMKLEPIHDSVSTMRTLIKSLERQHEVYYVTSRPGLRTKRQSEIWLMDHLCYPMRVPGVMPTVLVSSEKGAVAKALKLDAYVDDNLDNTRDVLVRSPNTRMYLLNWNYNAGAASVNIPQLDGRIDTRTATRISTLGQMFDTELPNL